MTAMPHSVSPEEEMPPAGIEDAMADTTIEHGASQESNDDITMAEPHALPSTSNAAGGDEKKEVKLEDLFADVESDDEFPSSRPQEIKMSSSPEGPSSPPAYVLQDLPHQSGGRLTYQVAKMVRRDQTRIQSSCAHSTSACSPGGNSFSG